ncbi:putative uncharacterized protein [Waddlia chondrophila 2032/99]|nr:putative uncharacterized protein [Waddlia chondrophila 2032/99]
MAQASKISPKFIKEKLAFKRRPLLTPKERIDKMLLASPSRYQFRGLSYQVAQSIKNLSPNQRKELYSSIEKAFRLVEHEDSNSAWIQRADLLDAIDVLVEDSSGELKPMLATSVEKQRKNKEDVPLVPYKQIKEATIIKTEQMRKKIVSDKKIELEPLDPVMVFEHSKAAKSVKKLTSREIRMENFLSVVYRTLTYVLGKYQANKLFGSARFLASMSRQLEIESSEYLVRKEKDEKTGEKKLVGYYRGPKFLFGKSVHEYSNRNEWFKRSLTSAATAEYLQGVEVKEAKLTAKYGPSGQVSRLVVANSDSRIRHHVLNPDEFGKTQELTGKVLNVEAEKEAKSKGDSAAYYSEKYKFSTKNLVGRENDDSMEIQTISKKMKNSEKLYVAAQHELLGGLWRAFDRQGAVQVVQRLAPADIHNYVAPLDGKPLNHKEACEVLKKRIEERLNQLQHTSKDEKEALQKEVAHLEHLIQIFADQEEELGRASQATIDIYGTNESVSTPAISNKSSILAQNDRKIMMFLHEDGSFSMHVFIGATGVNKVDVDQQTKKKMKRGARQGDMQFGKDRIEKRDDFHTATAKKTVDSHRKLRLGEWKGGFPINGSTVISYYLKDDFRALPKVDRYKKAVAVGTGMDRQEIEIKANMGDPLLIKTEILYAQVVERCFPNMFTPLPTVDEVKQQILLQDLGQRNLADDKQMLYFEHDQEVLQEIQELLKKENLTFDEQKMLEKFDSILEKRIDCIKENSRLATQVDLETEDVEDAKEMMVEGIAKAAEDSSLVEDDSFVEALGEVLETFIDLYKYAD